MYACTFSLYYFGIMNKWKAQMAVKKYQETKHLILIWISVYLSIVLADERNEIHGYY